MLAKEHITNYDAECWLCDEVLTNYQPDDTTLVCVCGHSINSHHWWEHPHPTFGQDPVCRAFHLFLDESFED